MIESQFNQGEHTPINHWLRLLKTARALRKLHKNSAGLYGMVGHYDDERTMLRELDLALTNLANVETGDLS